MSNFDKAHKFTAKWEGGLSDHPADNGGITAYGASLAFITDLSKNASGAAFLKSIGVAVPVTREVVKTVTSDQAKAMFKHAFWDKMKLDEYPYKMAAVLYDAGVNSGIKQSSKLAQRGFNAWSDKKYPFLAEDGILGPKSKAALKEYCCDELIRFIIQARRNFYAAIVNNKPSQKVFLKGWNNRADDLQRTLLG